MPGHPLFYQDLLRPVVLQILRAAGYHATRLGVVDWLTELMGRYMSRVCQQTAMHALHNHGDDLLLDGLEVDMSAVRAALDDMGALLPRSTGASGGEGEGGGVEEFVRWFEGGRNRDLMEAARDGDSDATDYLMALKRKHDKSADENRYHGTLLGRPLDSPCDVFAPGGPDASINDWMDKRSRACFETSPRGPAPNGHPSPSASSGLGSVDRAVTAAAAAAVVETAEAGGHVHLMDSS
ncbi:hypothetical protein CDD81_4933 [Ophiocordyceps australis]|uniref:Bromodomain associated domain-containing protein n=1 Tax=Ophiocordyceps australis TaxID=1399860 RepID=A0A2C5Y8Z2_9HYPO|nr:hypothetical protein CDD81_4933 [Ophiocordyceps australis]